MTNQNSECLKDLIIMFADPLRTPDYSRLSTIVPYDHQKASELKVADITNRYTGYSHE